MSEESVDWSRFRKSIVIRGPLSDVCEARASPEELTVWFLEEARYFDNDNLETPTEELIGAGDRQRWK